MKDFYESHRSMLQWMLWGSAVLGMFASAAIRFAEADDNIANSVLGITWLLLGILTFNAARRVIGQAQQRDNEVSPADIAERQQEAGLRFISSSTALSSRLDIAHRLRSAPLATCCHTCVSDLGAVLRTYLLDDPTFAMVFAGMIVCSTCGNKRCPKATDHRLTCTHSNEAGQEGSVYA